jgi:hypothetical protein
VAEKRIRGWLVMSMRGRYDGMPSISPALIRSKGLTLPHDVSSQIRLSESRTSKWVRPEDIDSALQANGILVGSGT